MGRESRLFRICAYLEGGNATSTAELGRRLEVSESTIKRDLAHLRDRMGWPLEYSREHGGWYRNRHQPLAGRQYELPNLHFSASEIHALLMMQHLLNNLDAGGLLGAHLAPLRTRLEGMLEGDVPPDAELVRRVRVLTVGARRLNLQQFQELGSALLRRKRALIAYHSRTRDEKSERVISPQRMVLYRSSNWYVEAWCHMRNGLRSFAIDAIDKVRVIDQQAIDVPDAELDAALGRGYGIFGGERVQWARLRFSAERARWVAAESWHPEQHGEFDEEGRYELRLPYTSDVELSSDILRHLPDVTVLGPPSLDAEVRRRVAEAMRRWQV